MEYNNRFENLIIENNENDILFISLGQQCGVAYNLEKFGYKEETLPFDWIRTPNFSTIVNLIENNFRDFLNPKLLSYNENDDIKYYFKNKLTKCEFVHECEEENFTNIEKKYKRRIERFYDKIKSNNRIVFIRDIYRHNYSKNYIDANSLISFNNIIKQINPELEYVFIIIYKDDIIPNKIISSLKEKIPSNIQFIKDVSYGRHWKREQINWKQIFDSALLYFDNPQSSHIHAQLSV